jgi:hypothetical protein
VNLFPSSGKKWGTPTHLSPLIEASSFYWDGSADWTSSDYSVGSSDWDYLCLLSWVQWLRLALPTQLGPMIDTRPFLPNWVQWLRLGLSTELGLMTVWWTQLSRYSHLFTWGQKHQLKKCSNRCTKRWTKSRNPLIFAALPLGIVYLIKWLTNPASLSSVWFCWTKTVSSLYGLFAVS